MTASEILRAAAARLHTLAELATPGPWRTFGSDDPGQWMIYDDQWCVANATAYWHNDALSAKATAHGPAYINPDANAEWIATMSPVIAVPLATWLMAVAIDFDTEQRTEPETSQQECALAFAQAILGSEQR
jgi:hypothetical protein